MMTFRWRCARRRPALALFLDARRSALRLFLDAPLARLPVPRRSALGLFVSLALTKLYVKVPYSKATVVLYGA